MTSRPRRWRIEPTDEWEQVEFLCGWPEQRDYELIRPLVLFGAPADGRSQETGASSGRTLRSSGSLDEVSISRSSCRQWPFRTAGARWAGRPGSSPRWGWPAIRPGQAPCPGRCRGIAACPGR